MMSVELTACPFCGIDCAVNEDDGDGYFLVICTCTAQGPLREGEAEAIAAWNTRPQSSPAVDGGLERRDEELLKLLRAIESASPDFIGANDGGCHTCYHRNPEGPEAADRLSLLLEENARLREALGAIIDHGVERDVKWAGMNARDIARATLRDNRRDEA